MRLYLIAFIADITKAFLQIMLEGDDAHAIRFLWVKDPTDPNSPVVEYRWLRVTFGLTCSSFILRAVIHKLMQEYEATYPDTVR